MNQGSSRWLAPGLFLTTFAGLQLELLDSRLLSVLTWYHLSFAAISLAMLGMAAGAVLVFLAGERVRGDAAKRMLVRSTAAMALAVPATHIPVSRMLVPPISGWEVGQVVPLATVAVALAIPFLLAGISITIALTRVGGRVGFLYGWDLLGAAAGCMLIVPVLDRMGIVSAALAAGAVAAVGAICFARFAGTGTGIHGAVFATLLLGAIGNTLAGSPLEVRYARGRPLSGESVQVSRGNAYSHVHLKRPRPEEPYIWGGPPTTRRLVEVAMIYIDGEAGTPMTRWDGDVGSLDWVRSDITTVAYHIRKGGDTGIIGPGGGRDILSALWAESRSITAIELNEIIVDLLEGSQKEFANLTTRDDVRLVCDDARSFLTRTDLRFDVLQMSLIDTWASTGAGAFTLTENALYTIEGWRVFLDRLKPNGVLAVSRWFSPYNVSETSRLVSLAVAALIDRGISKPSDHIALLSFERLATLIVSPSPLPAGDVEQLREVAARFGFLVLVAPGNPSPEPRLRRILESDSLGALAEATADPVFDYGPPTDDRPYFFNMLKLTNVYRILDLPYGDVFKGQGGVLWGNIRATATLAALFVIAAVLVLVLILAPLAISGLPSMPLPAFAASIGYFAIIGYGFMSVQIPLLQRFSVYLGHPIYTYSVILFAMILFAGLGSLASDRFSVASGAWPWAIPLAIAAMLFAWIAIAPAVLTATVPWGLVGRGSIVVSLTAPVSFLLGFCFPFGMRLVGAVSHEATAWMWGINGACGVLASIGAVMLSVGSGISTNLVVAAVLYTLLAPAAIVLRGVGRRGL